MIENSSKNDKTLVNLLKHVIKYLLVPKLKYLKCVLICTILGRHVHAIEDSSRIVIPEN